MTDANATYNDPVAAIVSSVGLKLLPFWQAVPQLWFAQFESKCSTGGITLDLTKFYLSDVAYRRKLRQTFVMFRSRHQRWTLTEHSKLC